MRRTLAFIAVGALLLTACAGDGDDEETGPDNGADVVDTGAGDAPADDTPAADDTPTDDAPTGDTPDDEPPTDDPSDDEPVDDPATNGSCISTTCPYETVAVWDGMCTTRTDDGANADGAPCPFELPTPRVAVEDGRVHWEKVHPDGGSMIGGIQLDDANGTMFIQFVASDQGATATFQRFGPSGEDEGDYPVSITTADDGTEYVTIDFSADAPAQGFIGVSYGFSTDPDGRQPGDRGFRTTIVDDPEGLQAASGIAPFA